MDKSLTPRESSEQYPQTEKLQKVLARLGVASRRASEKLIEAGRITVNGRPAHLGDRVSDEDVIAFDGHLITTHRERVTIVLNKPAGYLTSMSDPFNRPCISELLPLDVHPSLFPVGRLDKDTTGVLLCSTDGELSLSLIHPRYHVEKTYQAWVRGVVDDEELLVFREGIILVDGKTKPASARVLSHNKSNTLVELVLTEGKKRQVKRMMDAIGHPVYKLCRTSFDCITTDGLAPGSWRYVTPDESARLYAIHDKIRALTSVSPDFGA